MGCMSSTSNQSANKNTKKPVLDSEVSFKQMKDQKKIDNKDDLIVNKAAFVAHKDVKEFSKMYKIDDNILGEGAFGMVKKCYLRNSKEARAVKIMDKSVMSETEKVRLQYEIEILKNLSHPNIVHLYETFEDQKSFYLVTELCDGRELFEEISLRKKFNEVEAAIVVKQIFEAINYCHDNKVAHRDLKPENILIDSKAAGAIKIIDFGTSQVFDPSSATDPKSGTMKQMYGTTYYIAPEVLKADYTEKCDIWSIGVILYIMLSGQPPFIGNSDKEILRKVAVGAFEMSGSVWDKRSDDAKDLIRNLLNYKPEERFSAERALQHRWIQRKVQTKTDYNLADDALSNLAGFNASEKLKQAALTYIVTQMTTKVEQNRLKDSFKQFDLNGDGKIDKDEFKKAYKNIYPDHDEEKIDEECERLFTAADVDKSGVVDYNEWCAATINKREVLNDRNLRTSFDLFDKDQSGTITANEVKQILGHDSANDDVWDEIIKECDKDGDGLISYDEFIEMMGKLFEQQENASSQNTFA